MIYPIEGFPQHIRQPWPWGCMAYAAYSLTGDKHILTLDTVTAPHHFADRLGEMGYFLQTAWADCVNHKSPPVGWWADFLRQFSGEAWSCALLTITSTAGPHTVGAVLSAKGVHILDPASPAAAWMPPDAFIRSRYARAYCVEILLNRDCFFKAFPDTPGYEAPHVSPEIRSRYMLAELEKGPLKFASDADDPA